jgi:hypothetical protein
VAYLQLRTPENKKLNSKIVYMAFDDLTKAYLMVPLSGRSNLVGLKKVIIALFKTH